MRGVKSKKTAGIEEIKKHFPTRLGNKKSIFRKQQKRNFYTKENFLFFSCSVTAKKTKIWRKEKTVRDSIGCEPK